VSDGVPIPDAALALLERSINGYLALDPEGAARIGRLHGRVILIEVAGFGTRIYVLPGAGRLMLHGDYAGEPDCVLRGSPLSLARLRTARNKEDSLFSGEVTIAGDTEVAQAFGDILGGIAVDWEEQLARLVGDAAAHQVGARAHGLAEWGRRSAATLRADLTEYLQEEARLLPGRFEVETFMDEVDRLRDDVERLAARVDRLAKRMPEGQDPAGPDAAR